MWATLMPSSMIRHLLRAHLVCSQSYSPSSYRTLPSPFLQARGLHTSTKSSVLPPIRATLEEIRVILRDIDVDVSCASIEDEIRYLTVKLEDEQVWIRDHHSASRDQIRRDGLRARLKVAHELRSNHVDLNELMDVADSDMIPEVEAEAASLHSRCKEHLTSLWLSEPLDSKSATIEIHAGSGGTDACDWAAMLARMYTKWAYTHDYTVKVAEETPGDIAGVKSTTLLVEGLHAYGYAQYETGVHRLVRNSPFDKGGARHTSFASVRVSPYLEEDCDIETGIILSPSVLKITTMRSQGAGGQHVNKTESAVRVLHIPTGISVTCQQERSQHRNKTVAISILRSKLFDIQLTQRARNKAESHRALEGNAWGSQIRSYTLNPYQMVKDLRTGYQVNGAHEILEGKLAGLMDANLRKFKQQINSQR